MAVNIDTDIVSKSDTYVQLERIIKSKLFIQAPKMSNFLTYIVTEFANGRTKNITAMAIAEFVYERGKSFKPQSDPIIRVEAGRLRNRLREYYAEAGANDTVEIQIPKGAYIPVIKHRLSYASSGEREVSSNTTTLHRPYKLYPLQIIGIGLGGFAIGILCSILLFNFPTEDKSIAPKFTKNLEVYSMFLESISVARPPTMKVRVLFAIDLARKIQVMDPNFGGGFAAESFQYWQYILFGHSKTPEADTQRTLILAHKAIETDPEFGWGFKSLSRALLLIDDREGAIGAARHAVELAAADAEMLGNLGLILTVTGRPAEAMASLKKALLLAKGNVRTPYLNYLGIAQFHNQEFSNAAATIERNSRIGGPMGPHMYAYLAAAHSMLGNSARARAFAQKLKSDKSEFSIMHFIDSLIKNPDDREELFSALKKAGLNLKNLSDVKRH
jgi:Tfp pilus assembly protein PilF